MATSETLADVIKQSNQALAETLASAFKNLKYQRASTVKLAKFCGSPKRSCDPTLKEWVEDLKTYLRQLGLSEEEQVGVAIDHLGGVAREEILCCPKEGKNTLEKVLALSRRRFGTPETVQSLNCTFYSRNQLEEETLADFSRALIRLYDRMESASTNVSEKSALAQLRDGALKEQFIRGSRDTAIKRELRELSHDEPELSFFQFRELALKLLRDSEDSCDSEPKSEQYPVDQANSSVAIDAVNTGVRANKEQILLTDLAEGQKQLTTLVESLVKQQTETNACIKSLTAAVEKLTTDSTGPRLERRVRGP